VPFSQEADIYVINTCAVTNKAATQSRRMIRRALKNNPKARVVVTGCYSQIASKEIFKMTEQPLCIVGNGFKDQLVDIAMAEDCCDLELFMGDISRRKGITPLPVTKFSGRTRAYLKVQDGCDRFCSYCIVPYARGPSRSLPAVQVLEQARVLIDQGYKEIVLTGIHIGLYGQDLEPEIDLVSLLEKLLSLKSKVRYRISSLESSEISDPLLELIAASEAVMPHLHIPLQSGDDTVLRRMNRPYTKTLYRQTVEKCVARMPDAAIGVDVLVGFPGESEASFQTTRKFLEELPVSYLHVFPYSKRPGTVAAEMPDQVSAQEKDRRVAMLRQLDHQKRTAFYGRFVGTSRPVLAESAQNRFKLMRGFSDNYIPVYFAAPESVVNEVVDVTISRLVDDHVFGRLVCKEEKVE
ncbi:MAG: tRNA (N(6)-L-threonylcarbamoyladenosine(37)-C(2))-methylthiotransferase MtaB, partial [Deltaproteobacteria bacterium]